MGNKEASELGIIATTAPMKTVKKNVSKNLTNLAGYAFLSQILHECNMFLLKLIIRKHFVRHVSLEKFTNYHLHFLHQEQHNP